jgi:hypothetical protein
MTLFIKSFEKDKVLYCFEIQNCIQAKKIVLLDLTHILRPSVYLIRPLLLPPQNHGPPQLPM